MYSGASNLDQLTHIRHWKTIDRSTICPSTITFSPTNMEIRCDPCQGTSLAVCTPFIYPVYCSYSTFISLCLHICLLLFGYDLTLSCSQYTLFISLLLEPPCCLLALAALFSLHRLPTLFRVISPLSLQVALTDPEPRVRGGVWPKAKKKKVTTPILMAEVVVDVPKGTLDGSPGVQDVLSCYSNCIGC